MKFCFFSAQYLPTIGGVERYTFSLAKQLIKQGHEVMVVTSALANLPDKEIDEHGICIYRLPVIWAMQGRFPVIIPSKQLKKFFCFFAQEKPDACIIQTKFYFNSILGAFLCKKHGIPGLVIDHSTSHLLQKGLLSSFANGYEHWACHYIFKRCPDFYGVSQNSCQWLNHFGIQAKDILYNAIDLSTIQQIAAKEKSDYGINENAQVVLFSGRLIEEKGILKLIKAFQSLELSKNSAVLVILGQGPVYQKVKEQESETILVLGNQDYKTAIGLCKMADIFCLPSDYPEGFPTTILEAAACNTFVITTDKGGSIELIKNKDYGIILQQNNVKEIAQALGAALGQQIDTNACIQKAYTHAISTFTWEKTANKIIQLIRGKYENVDYHSGL